MNAQQAARLAGVQAATRYVSSVSGSPEDIMVMADDLAHYILTGETVRTPKEQAPVTQEKLVESAGESGQQANDLREITAVAFARRAYEAKSRSEVEAIRVEVIEANVEDASVSEKGKRVNLLDYLRACWTRLPREEVAVPEHQFVPDQKSPQRTPSSETVRSEMNL